MKKLLSFMVIAALGMSTTFAQTAAPAAKKETKKIEKKAAAQVSGLKKDGTPDKRLKANAATIVKVEPAKAPVAAKKAAVTQAAGLKKDGTPDLRLKANKTAKVATGPGPKKKDGTPDLRYKVNKEAAKRKN